jgi:starch phosphorylase
VKKSGYRPHDAYDRNLMLREVIDFISSGALAGGDVNLFRPLVENLLWHDPFLVLADFQSYMDCQAQVSDLWHDPQMWMRKSILNVARMGKFSSDRSIREYSDHVWHAKPVPAMQCELEQCLLPPLKHEK